MAVESASISVDQEFSLYLKLTNIEHDGDSYKWSLRTALVFCSLLQFCL